MRVRPLLLTFAVAASIVAAAPDARAQQLPAGTATCGVYFGVVFPPALISQVSTGRGVFGSTVGVPSGVTCAGSLVGTATVTGVSTFCPPKGDEAMCPARVGIAPDTAPVWTTLNGLPAALFASVYAEAVLTPDAGTGLRWADDPAASRGLVTCTIVGHGIGSAILTLVQYQLLECRGANETSSRVFTGVANLVEEILLGPAGNLVTSTEPGYEQLCPDPLTTGDPNDFQCFRSVILQGEITVTEPGIV